MSEQTVQPRYLLLDSDVLLQAIATSQLSLLRELRNAFDLRLLVMPAVHSETARQLETNRKFIGRQEQLKKAIGNGLITLVDKEFISQLSPSPASILDDIDAYGQQLYRRVDRGEAYTHAASMRLKIPVCSNDVKAIRVLLKAGEPVQTPVVRFWDLIVLGCQHGAIQTSTSDVVRKDLLKIGETIHPSFLHNSFADGLSTFYLRLYDGDCHSIGSDQPVDRGDERITIFHVTRQMDLLTNS